MRKLFLSGSKLQHRYLRLIILSIMLPTFIVGGCLYYLIFSLLAKEIAIPEFIAQILFPVIKRVNLVLLFGLPAAFLILFWTGLVISHRLAGPVERLKKELDGIVAGDYSKRILLRKNDDLKPVADSINKILDKLGK